MSIEAVFLGINDAGEEVYDWLNQREDVSVTALLTEEEQLDLIERIEPDIVVSSGFEHKVPKKIIDIPEKGIVNLHPSYLPYNRGSHPYIWPIVDGSPAGVSLHYMVPELDEGPIIDKREVEVTPEDTAENLYNRLAQAQVQLFKENWNQIKQNNAELEEQNLENGTVHYSRELEDLCQLELSEKVEIGEFIDRLRALTFPPHKTAYFERYGKKYYVKINIIPEEEW